jgi:hypothetical protein
VWRTLAGTNDLQTVVNAVAELLSEPLGFQAFGVNTFWPDAGFKLAAAWNGLFQREAGETMDELHRRMVESAGLRFSATPRRWTFSRDTLQRRVIAL